MKRCLLFCLALAFTTPATSVFAQDAAKIEEAVDESVIVVTAAGQTFRARGGELRAAQRAFRKHRDHYAPQSELILQLSSPTMAAAQLSEIDLWLISDDQRIRLELDENMRFRLPELTNDKWEIATRRRGLRLNVSPWVFSPGSEIGNWRLGDLMLQCHVALAVMRTSMNPLQSAMFGIAGGCNSKRTAVWQGVPNPVVSGVVSEPAHSSPLEVSGRSFRLPTDLQNFSYEARATLEFEGS